MLVSAFAAALLGATPVEPPDPPADPIAAARAELEAMDAELDAELEAQEAADPAGEADPFASRGLMPTDEAIALFERRIGGNAGDFRNRTVLGRLLLRKAKEEDDHAAAARAVDVLRAARAANPDDGPARTYLAVALLAQHGFAEARELARASAAADPRDTLALATAGDAALELGRIDEADAAFARLQQKIGRSPAVLARLARSAELRGRPGDADELIAEATAAAIAAGAPPGDLAWYEWRRGRLAFDRGDLDAAGERFRRAIELAPDDAPAHAGLAAVAAARGEFDRAIELYTEAVERFGEPPLSAALGDVLAAAGRTEAVAARWDAAEAGMAEEAKTAETPHLREFARFLADHDRDPARAVELARRDLKVRQDVYAHDTLAWALYRAGAPEEAAREAERAAALGTRDATLFYHRGLIHAARGERAAAREALRTALAINPAFDPLGAPAARRALDRLGENAANAAAEGEENPAGDGR